MIFNAYNLLNTQEIEREEFEVQFLYLYGDALGLFFISSTVSNHVDKTVACFPIETLTDTGFIISN